MYRLDSRGLKCLAAAGPQTDPRSLRTLPGGAAFTWREGTQRKPRALARRASRKPALTT